MVLADMTLVAANPPGDDLEILMGMRNAPEILYLHVESNGCTEEGDFRIATRPSTHEADAVVFELRRIVPDECKRWCPEGVELAYAKDEVGVTGDFIMANPFLGSPPLAAPGCRGAPP